MQLFRRRRAEVAAAPAPSRPALGPHLLVCDDNESVTQMVRLMFANESWDVESVTNGPDCLAAMERQAPDVVLLDQQLGAGLTGLETAALAREAAFDRPILLFSAYLDETSRTRAEELDVLTVSKVDFRAVVQHVNAAHRAYRRRAARHAAPTGDARRS